MARQGKNRLNRRDPLAPYFRKTILVGRSAAMVRRGEREDG
jgi:hypothetical protein